MSLGFLGEYQHALDAKGRVILPSDFREPLAAGAVLTKSLDGCLAVYSAEGFDEMAELVRESARRGERERRAARSFFSAGRRFTPDKQGRVPIPQNLREYAGLERDVMVLGVDNRIELWNPVRWREHDALGQSDMANGEGLADVGFI
ncbi:MAG TPA: division/cell wall cluster transcriptional repressor MraZ [Acidimicrobiia bacterium]|jgi:MraZ protein